MEELQGDLLRVEKLVVEVGDRRPVRGVDLSIGEGEVHVLLGPNGAGKSTLLKAVMGMPGLRIIEGRIVFSGRDITGLPANERARLGIAMMFQNPPRLRGVTLRDLASELSRRYGSSDGYADLLGLDGLMERSLHDGYSGGESKRAELYLAALQKPRLALLDEPDSGVDVENLAKLGDAVNRLVEEGASLLIVTHTGHILSHLRGADKAHIMVDGRIIFSGDAIEVIPLVMKYGFRKALEKLEADA